MYHNYHKYCGRRCHQRNNKPKYWPKTEISKKKSPVGPFSALHVGSGGYTILNQSENKSPPMSLGGLPSFTSKSNPRLVGRVTSLNS